MTTICETCDLPAAPHKQEECMQELIRKKKIADVVFAAAVHLTAEMGDPHKIRNKAVQQAVLDLDLATWRYAM